MSKRRPTTLVLLLVLGLLAGCGGPAVAGFSPPVPESTTYGSGTWSFTVSFLAKPSHTGVRSIPRRDTHDVAPDTFAVASDSYSASFKNSSGGFSREKVTIVEFSRPLPLHGCVLKLLEPVGGGCPERHGNTLASGFSRCTPSPPTVPTACIGYGGGVIDVRGKTVFNLGVFGASRASVRAVVDSFSIAP